MIFPTDLKSHTSLCYFGLDISLRISQIWGRIRSSLASFCLKALEAQSPVAIQDSCGLFAKEPGSKDRCNLLLWKS